MNKKTNIEGLLETLSLDSKAFFQQNKENNSDNIFTADTKSDQKNSKHEESQPTIIKRRILHHEPIFKPIEGPVMKQAGLLHSSVISQSVPSNEHTDKRFHAVVFFTFQNMDYC